MQLVGLADELHVAVLDAVVDHLHVVAGAVLADPVAAGRAVVDLGGDGLEDRLHVRPCRGLAAGHDATGRDARLPRRRTRRCRCRAGPCSRQSFVRRLVSVIERVAAVDDDVARFEVRQRSGR